MTRDDSFSSRVFALVSLGTLAVGVFWIIRPFIVPLLWAGLLALLLFPANLALRRALRGRSSLAALLLTAAVILVIVIPAVVLVGLFVTQASDLARWLQTSASEHHIAGPTDVLELPAVDRAIRWAGQFVPDGSQGLQSAVVRGGQQLLQSLLALAGSVFAGALEAATSVVLALFLFFFFLRDGEEFVHRAFALLPMEPAKKTHLMSHLAAVATGVVLGSLATALVQGILVGVAFAIAGLPTPIVFGVLATVASLIPLVGSALVWAPAAAYLALKGSWGWAAFMAVWGGAIVSTADNIVRPVFVSSRARISTLPVFIGLFGGVNAFGPVGMFLGPVLVALMLALVRFAEEAQAGDGRGVEAHR